MTVKLHHPDLDRTIEVSEKSVPIHERNGWQRVDEKDAAKKTESRSTARADRERSQS